MSYLEFKPNIMSLEERIEFARQNTSLEPNCYGTTFFLLGVLPYDRVIFSGHGYIRRAISRMNQVDSLRNNSIMISSIGKFIQHATFIQQSNPLKGYHRKGSSDGFDTSDFSEVTEIEDAARYLRTIREFAHPDIQISNSFYTLKTDDNLSDWAKEMVEKYNPAWWA